MREVRPAALNALLPALTATVLEQRRSGRSDAFVIVESGAAYTQAAIQEDSAHVEAVGPSVLPTDASGLAALGRLGFEMDSPDPNYSLQMHLRDESDASALATLLLAALAAGHGIHDPDAVSIETP